MFVCCLSFFDFLLLLCVVVNESGDCLKLRGEPQFSQRLAAFPAMQEIVIRARCPGESLEKALLRVFRTKSLPSLCDRCVDQCHL